MDKAKEILKFQALLQMAATCGEDLHAEMQYQMGVLHSLGVSDCEINNFIHDRHAREGISLDRAALALTSIRQAAGLPNFRDRRYSFREHQPSRTKSREEKAAEYLRARGKDLRKVAPEAPGTASFVLTEAMPGGLRVPYGVDPDADIVHAKDASRDVNYSCPGCGAELVLHAGEFKARHFAHKPNTTCNGESIAHITAKLLIAKIIRVHQTSDQRIRLQCTCDQCHSPVERILPPESFTTSEVEAPVGDFVCDVIAVKDDMPVLAVEIFHSSAVNQVKAETLAIPWVELAASDVLDDPWLWRPVRARLKPTMCAQCKAKQRVLSETAARWRLPQPNPPYRGAVAACWKCQEEIVWYWWPDVPFAKDRPPEPIPRIVKKKFSRAYGGEYWMNTCPGCSAPQGDNFVFLANDSPFKGLQLRETESMKEHRLQETRHAVGQFMNVFKRNFGAD